MQGRLVRESPAPHEVRTGSTGRIPSGGPAWGLFSGALMSTTMSSHLGSAVWAKACSSALVAGRPHLHGKAHSHHWSAEIRKNALV